MTDPLTRLFRTQKQDYDAEELRRIAEVFCYVCGTQSEADAYWCYSAFLQCREQIYGHHATGIYHQVRHARPHLSPPRHVCLTLCRSVFLLLWRLD